MQGLAWQTTFLGWERLRSTYEVLPPCLSTGSQLSGLAVKVPGWVGTQCNVQPPYEVFPSLCGLGVQV